MHIEPLGLQHRDLLNKKFSALGLSISEYTFANAYLFRNTHSFFVIFNSKIYLRGKTRDGVLYYMPTEPVTAKDFYDLQQSVGEPITLFPIPEQWLPLFPEPDFIREFSPADSDYLYPLEQMRTYHGHGLTGQRNHVKQFESLYEAVAKPLTLETRQGAIDLLNRWHRDNQEADYHSCLEALQRHVELSLQGMVYYVDNTVIALAIGEPLNREVYVIHFCKADIHFKGVYEYVYQHYAKHLNDNYQLINLEQDLGTPGLRKAKLSYHPIRLEAKWRIRSLNLSH